MNLSLHVRDEQQSKQWVEVDGMLQRWQNLFYKLEKVMATVFGDSQCMVFVDYLQSSEAINGEYYEVLLEHLNNDIKAKCPHLEKRHCTRSYLFNCSHTAS